MEFPYHRVGWKGKRVSQHFRGLGDQYQQMQKDSRRVLRCNLIERIQNHVLSVYCELGNLLNTYIA